MTIQPWRSPASRYAPTALRGGWPAGSDASGGRTGVHPAGSAMTAQTRPRLPLPPSAMPLRHGTRPLKRWCYVGMFGSDVMLCAGTARVGPLPQAFWAVWDRRTGVLDTQTQLLRTDQIRVGPKSVSVRSGSARLELAVSPAGEPVEVVSPHGRSYIWTRKVPIRVDGHLTLGIEVRSLSGYGILDESAGYHSRQTEWEWSAGVGTTVDGWPVTWNLVRGVHDSDTMSERTVWVNGRPAEVPPVRFSDSLDELWGWDGSVLQFEEEATRRRRESLGLVASDYVQPFGRFHGTLPGGVELSEREPALGVMERHKARW